MPYSLCPHRAFMPSPLADPTAEALAERERAALTRLRAALAEAGTPPATLARLDELVEGLGALFLVVVVGEFNAGKSSVLNALFGQRLLEEGPVPTTDRITVLQYGEAPASHRVGDFVVERALPAPLLRHLTLVDTPGTNSIIKEHQRITEDFIPRADLVLFITSFDRPLSESERAFLGFVREEWGKRLIFVVNKKDLAENEQTLGQVLDHVRSGSERLMGFVPTIFPVAARLALAAQEASPFGAQSDPRWEASGFADLVHFLTQTLTDDERLALKLTAPLDAGRALVSRLDERVAQVRSLAQQDRAALDGIEQDRKAARLHLENLYERHVAAVADEIRAMEDRGVQFLKDSIRVSKITLLRDRDAFKEEFRKQVVRDGERRIEERMGEAVDGLLRHVLELWNAAHQRLADLARASKRDRPDDSFLYNREEILREVTKEGRRTIETYDLEAEGRRILENARSAATMGGAATVGLGALAVGIIALSAFDVTGGVLAALAFGTLGFVVLPRQRSRAVKEFRARVETLRTELAASLRTAFDEEVRSALGRVEKLVAPVEALARQQTDLVARLEGEQQAVDAEMAAIREDVVSAYGEPPVGN